MFAVPDWQCQSVYVCTCEKDSTAMFVFIIIPMNISPVFNCLASGLQRKFTHIHHQKIDSDNLELKATQTKLKIMELKSQQICYLLRDEKHEYCFFQLPNISKIKAFHIDTIVQKFEVSFPFISIKVSHLLEVFLFYHIADLLKEVSH